MINPATIAFVRDDGTKHFVLIEPLLEKAGNTLKSTGVFKLYKDAAGDESALFTEPLELEEGEGSLQDAVNPDYLGKINLPAIGDWHYEGDLLTQNELSKIAEYLKKH